MQRWQGVAAALAFQPAERAERDPRRWQGVAAAPVCPKEAAAAWRPWACRVAAVAVLQQQRACWVGEVGAQPPRQQACQVAAVAWLRALQ